MRGWKGGAGALMGAGAVMLLTGEALADPALRVQVSQRGGFVLIGNTLGHDCVGTTPPQQPYTLGSCGMNTADGAIDVYWRSDSPTVGTVEGDLAITAQNARSSAQFNQPSGSTVTHAFLYWAATRDGGGYDPVVTLDREGGFTAQVDAGTDCLTGNVNAYQCAADVTALVQQNGPGAYRVSGVDATDLVDLDNEGNYSVWYMVVLYERAAEPIRNLAVFDGLDVVLTNMEKTVVLDGFLVPPAAKDGRLGVVGIEGDVGLMGDQLLFAGQTLGDNKNPPNNFFNRTHAILGVNSQTPGDLPLTTGNPGALSSLDLDVVDIGAKLSPGQTSAPITGKATAGDQYILAAFVTQITDTRPEFSGAVLAAIDGDGDGFVPGDLVEYVVSAVNTGNDDAVDVVLSHELPAGVSYVDGSLEIVSGPNMGGLSDGPGDDQGEYDANANTVVVRLGAGADAQNGGAVAIGETSEVKFRVEIDADTSGAVSSQAFIGATGAMGGAPFPSPTDDDGVGVAAPTVFQVGACETAADCGGGQCLGGVCSTPDAAVDVEWATYAGAGGGETGAAVAVDGAGNLYLVGNAVSTSALATAGTHQPEYAGGASDAFLVKFAPSGERTWGTYFGGAGNDLAVGVAVDPLGDVLVTGITTSTAGVASPGALQAGRLANADGFVARFTSAGKRVWSTYLGSATVGTEYVNAAAFAVGGGAHVVGAVRGAFPFALPGPHDPSHNGSVDGYWLELDAAGALVQGTYYGGPLGDDVRGLVVDPAAVHLAGVTGSTTGIATPGAYDETLEGPSDGWVARFQPSGARVWGTYLGGPAADLVNGIARTAGGVAVAGTTNSATGIASPGALQPALAGANDGMVVRLDDAGARVWSTYYGGPADDSGVALTRDALGNLIVAGTTFSTAGIASVDGLHAAALGGGDAYLLKLDPAGARRWATYYGGAAAELASAQAVAAYGADDIYLAGRTGSSLGVATVDALFQPSFGGGTDVFLAHFGQGLGDPCADAGECATNLCVDGVCCESSCAGTCDVCSVAAGGAVDGTCALLPADECAGTLPTVDWSTYAGAAGAETGGSAAVDGAGNIYLAGTTSSTSGISTAGTHQFGHGGGPDDAFLLKFDPAGDRVWGTYLGGPASDSATEIAVDALGNVLVVGTTLSTSGIATPDGLQPASAGGRDGYAVLFDAEGQRVWGTYLGSAAAAGELAYGAAFDAAGDIYVVGDVAGDFPFALPTAHDGAPGGSTDAYLLALTADGAIQWGTYYGEAPADHARGVAVDDDLGLVYLVGHTASPTEIATPGAFDETLDGPSDGFVAAFDPAGARAWGTYLGGGGTDTGAGGAATTGGLAFVGTTDSPGLATADAHQAAPGGGEDALVVQLDADGGRVWSTYYGGPGDDQGAAIAVDPAGSLLLTGTTTSTAGIATDSAVQHDLLGERDVFVVKLAPGGQRRWGTYFGGDADDLAGPGGLATAAPGVVHVAGQTASLSGVATPDALYQPTFKGATDLFLARLSHGQGDTCTADLECDSGSCVDGVCCDGACGGGDDGDCQTCSVVLGAVADGVCSPVADQTPCATGVCMAGVCEEAVATDSGATAGDTGDTAPASDTGVPTGGGTGGSDSNTGGVPGSEDSSVPTGGGPGGAGDESGDGSASDSVGATDGGCGCATGSAPPPLAFGLLGLLGLRRRRR